MKEFALIFRMDIRAKISPQQMKEYMEQWQEWMESIPVVAGNHFSTEGRLLKANSVIKAEPYFVGKTAIAGYLVVEAKNLSRAVAIAKDVPFCKGKKPVWK